MSFDGIM